MAHKNPVLVAASGTLATGVVTISSSTINSIDYRTFAATLDDADTADVMLRDANGAQAFYPDSTWDETAGTLTLGTVAESTGSVADGAVTVWVAEKFSDALASLLPELAGAQIGGYRAPVKTSVSGSLTTAAHSGAMLVTSGNVTIPNSASDVGFSAILIAGGAHTVTFNSLTSAAMAAGDLLTVFVESTSVIHAVLTPAASKVSFT